MKAMILGAGLGTRLRPLTEAWPKPVLPLVGQPLIGYTLAMLKRAHVTSVGLNTHHLAETLTQVAFAECRRQGLELEVVHEPVIQGTAGGIRGLREFLGRETFVVVNGDVLFALDLAQAIAAHRASGAVATMVLQPMPPGGEFRPVEIDDQSQVRRIAGRGPGGAGLTPWHFTGVHVLEAAVFDFIPPEGEVDINRDVYPRVLEAGARVKGEVVEGYWSDLGTPARFLTTVRDVLWGQVPMAAFPGASPFERASRGEGNFWFREGARIEAAGVAGPAYFDAGSVVEAGVRIGSAVYVGPGARIGKGARLNRAVVLDDTTVAPGEELVDAIAWKEHRIPRPTS